MATFLDVTGLEYFSSFFVFIFVWLAVYAILVYTRAFGQNKAISILIGLLVGLFVLFSPIATALVNYIAPWFGVVFIFIILISVTAQMFGATGLESFTSLRAVALIMIIIAIFIGSFGYVGTRVGIGGDEASEEGGIVDYTKTSTFFLHPKVLGMLFVLIIAIFTVALLAGKSH